MRGGNFLALLLMLFAGVLFWLGWSGNYKAVGIALRLPVTASAPLSGPASGGGGSAGGF